MVLFANKLFRLDYPRTKKVCIEKYNQSISSVLHHLGNNLVNPLPSQKTQPATEWTGDQDKQSQVELAKHPSSIVKNEHWPVIAKEVDGKKEKRVS